MKPKDLAEIKIYHIVHLDKLSSIISNGRLFSYAITQERNIHNGTTIGMQEIKERRLTSHLSSYPNLTVGNCVPFYFCPRSIMLYVIHCQNNPDLAFQGGQQKILHLEFNLKRVLDWAEQNKKRCAFTTSNAGSCYFEDFSDFNLIYNKLNWEAINAELWRAVKEEKQAEFLIESEIDWSLVDTIGTQNAIAYREVSAIMDGINKHKPELKIIPQWYY